MDNQYQETQTAKKPAKKSKGLTGIVDMVVKFLPVITVIFLALAVIGFVYYAIAGVVSTIGSFSVGFSAVVSSFFGGIINAFTNIAKYLFYAMISACFSKILNRK